ncbi:metallophosphatase domain-containing protein [Ochrobactrum phage vB_OspM_OC]|nr:metallophosphatase domain-containing protein [Ochrobactrum phage vB_OspM_OC]
MAIDEKWVKYREGITNDILTSCKDFVNKHSKLPTFKDIREIGFSRDRVRSSFGNLAKLHELLSEATNTPIEDKKEDTKKEIIDVYIKIVSEKMRYPTNADFRLESISDHKIKSTFGNITNLHDHMREDHADVLDAIVTKSTTVFTKRTSEELDEELQKYKRFVITTAVDSKAIHQGFYESIKNYCDANEAKLLIVPCADVASRSNIIEDWAFDAILSEEIFIHNDVALNGNLIVSKIQMSAKQIKPTTGLKRILHEKGSVVCASPKQFLEYHPNKYSGIPNALMTTGAITTGDYSSDLYMSKRTSYIAEFDHVLGAIVVEIENNQLFHFRQIQADDDGSFIDLGVRYRPDGTTEKEHATLVLGDWHSGSTDPRVVNMINEVVNTVEIDNIVVHDLFDGLSVNHHIKNQPLKLAKRSIKQKSSLEAELSQCADDLDMLADMLGETGDIIIVKSNHDEWLSRYLDDGRFMADYENQYVAFDLARKRIEDDQDILEYAINTYGEPSCASRVQYLDRQSSFVIGGVELGSHGDIGTNGAKGSLDAIETAWGNAVIGHFHSAAIYRGVFRVGTSTKLKLEYTNSISSWTQTHCLVYDNGSRQLITLIGDSWKI